EEEAKKKAEAEGEAKRQADEALAKAEFERQRAEQEARQKAEAEAAARHQALDETQRLRKAEASETGLRLEQADRERLQVALTSLGFDTRGNDGVFGPRSREMISNWQKARNQMPTGFLTATQRQALLREAAPAVSMYDEQKKAEKEAKTSVTVLPAA